MSRALVLEIIGRHLPEERIPRALRWGKMRKSDVRSQSFRVFSESATKSCRKTSGSMDLQLEASEVGL